MRSPRRTGTGDAILHVKNNKPSTRKGLIRKKEVVKGEAALEAKEEEEFLDEKPQEEKPKTKKVWRKKEITPPSTPLQEEQSLSPDSPDTQEHMEVEK
jgi:hypothetical protein